MRNAVFVAIPIFTLGSSFPSMAGLFDTPASIKAPIEALKGKPVDDAIAYMGLPDGELTVAGRKVLVWNNGGDQKFYEFNANGGTSRSFHCTVKAVIGEADMISLIEIDADSAYYCPRGKK